MKLTDIHGPISDQPTHSPLGQCQHAATSTDIPQCTESATTRIGGVPLCAAHGDRSAMKPETDTEVTPDALLSLGYKFNGTFFSKKRKHRSRIHRSVEIQVKLATHGWYDVVCIEGNSPNFSEHMKGISQLLEWEEFALGPAEEEPAPTDKDSLEVPTLWRDLKPGENGQAGDRYFGLNRKWITLTGSFSNEAGGVPIQRPEPTNWQARAEELAEELKEVQKDYMCLARPLDGHDSTECARNLHRMIRELSASQAEVERLRTSLESIQIWSQDALTCTFLDDAPGAFEQIEQECAKALSPAEKGGEG